MALRAQHMERDVLPGRVRHGRQPRHPTRSQRQRRRRLERRQHIVDDLLRRRGPPAADGAARLQEVRYAKHGVARDAAPASRCRAARWRRLLSDGRRPVALLLGDGADPYVRVLIRWRSERHLRLPIHVAVGAHRPSARPMSASTVASRRRASVPRPHRRRPPCAPVRAATSTRKFTRITTAPTTDGLSEPRAATMAPTATMAQAESALRTARTISLPRGARGPTRKRSSTVSTSVLQRRPPDPPTRRTATRASTRTAGT